jgi:hypothetical protein
MIQKIMIVEILGLVFTMVQVLLVQLLCTGTPLSANAAAELKFSGREKGVGFT